MIVIDWLSTAILHSRYVKESKSKNFVGWELESNILLPNSAALVHIMQLCTTLIYLFC